MTSDVLPPGDRTAISPTADQLAAVDGLPADEAVVMLNLLRFREVADYSRHPDLAPDVPISGAEAYARYGAAAMPHLSTTGAELVYRASARATIIGPVGEEWDEVVLVRYPSPAAFLGMVTAPEYVRLSGHRTAALADSRLVATAPNDRPAD